MNSKKCTRCSCSLEANDQWCPECGIAVAASTTNAPSKKCHACGKSAETTDQWCASCGVALATPTHVMPATQARVSMPTLQPIGGADTGGAPLPPRPRSQSLYDESEQPERTARRGWNSVLGGNTCGSCFAQDVKNAPTCYKCGARFLTPEEIAVQEAEEAKTDLDRAREKARAALTETAAKASAVGQQTLRSAAETRAGKSLKDYWLGWVLIALVLVGGIGFIRVVTTASRKQSAEVARQTVASTPSPLPTTVHEQSRPQSYSQPQQVASPVWVSCPDCRGSGDDPNCDPSNKTVAMLQTVNGGPTARRAGNCISCGGTGKGRIANEFGILPDCTICRSTGRCPICGGSGRCQTCNGAGRLSASDAAQLQQFRQQMELQNRQIQQQTQQQYDWTRAN